MTIRFGHSNIFLRNDNETLIKHYQKCETTLCNIWFYLLIYVFIIPNQCTEPLILRLLYLNQYLIISLKIILNYSNAIMNYNRTMHVNANLAFWYIYKVYSSQSCIMYYIFTYLYLCKFPLQAMIFLLNYVQI